MRNDPTAVKDDIEMHDIEIGKEVAPKQNDSLLIDHKLARYPYCIVWTRIPKLTWYLPCFGHVGIAGYNAFASIWT